MGTSDLPVIAGMISTTVFATSMLPMLVKAAKTRDLSSYSIGNLILANIGNAIHSVYVVHLPPGPIWFLHGFYLLTTALMLCWWLRYRAGNGGGSGTPTGAAVSASASDVAEDPGRSRPQGQGRAPAGFEVGQRSCAAQGGRS